jgi:hypothetical protein
MRADCRRAVVTSAGSNRCLEKRVDGCAILGDDRDMQRFLQAAFAADPEIRFAISAKTGCWLIALVLRHFHDQRIAKRCQRF